MKTCVIPEDTALLFCYFNNNEYFHQYLQQYRGQCVILIGPIDGARHCDPEPDYLQVLQIFLVKENSFLKEKLQGHADWDLYSSFSLKEEDAISVYRRKSS